MDGTNLVNKNLERENLNLTNLKSERLDGKIFYSINLDRNNLIIYFYNK